MTTKCSTCNDKGVLYQPDEDGNREVCSWCICELGQISKANDITNRPDLADHMTLLAKKATAKQILAGFFLFVICAMAKTNALKQPC